MNAPLTKREAIAIGDVPALIPFLRHELQQRVANVPSELKSIKGWLCWRVTKIDPSTGKFNKIPVYPTTWQNRHGTQGSPEDMQSLGSFDEALAAWTSDPTLAGIGLALLSQFNVVALDADRCFQDNELRSDCVELTAETYCEVSPSGTGVRAFWRGSARDGKNHERGFELFHSKGFVTVTGNVVPNLHSIMGTGALPMLDDATRSRLEALASKTESPGAQENVSATASADWDEMESALAYINPSCGREEWITTGMALHHEGARSNNLDKAYAIWNTWSAHSDAKYPGERAMLTQWASFRSDKTTTAQIASLFHIAKKHGWVRPQVDASSMFGATGAVDDWPELQPLIAKLDRQAYPLDALPDVVRCAVQEVAGFVKAPIPLIASSALAALSLAIQAHVDVQRADKLHGPCGLFLLAIAESGERKTTCDGFFTKAIHDHEAAMLEAAKPEILDHKSKQAVWTAQRAGLVEKIKTLSKVGHSTAAKAQELHALDDNEPRPPRVPRLIYGDTTPEELGFKLATVWPSGGVVSSEAGTVFGGHAMGRDSAMRNMAMLNLLWDGATLKVDRRTSASFTVQGARLTMALQVQEATLQAFFDATKGLARGTGFLARFLLSWPESTQGTRNFTEAPANWPALATFNNRLSAILNRPVAIDPHGGLTPAMLTLAPDAKASWVRFHDAIEAELSPMGELAEVRDVASKCADNAARLAALFHVFAGNIGPIDLAAINAGARIAAWHLHEARRFLGELAMPAEVSNPGRLEAWMLDYCRREKTDSVPTREVLRRGPGSLRDKAAFADAIKELTELGRARLVQDGKKRQVQINPLLLA